MPEDEVEEQDRDEREDERLGRRPAHAFGPGSEWNPRWQLIRAIAAPKKKLLKTPANRSRLPTNSRECFQ